MLLKRFLTYTDALEHIERNEALFRTFGPKGMGHGGARVGSGQKKKKK